MYKLRTAQEHLRAKYTGEWARKTSMFQKKIATSMIPGVHDPPGGWPKRGFWVGHIFHKKIGKEQSPYCRAIYHRQLQIWEWRILNGRAKRFKPTTDRKRAPPCGWLAGTEKKFFLIESAKQVEIETRLYVRCGGSDKKVAYAAFVRAPPNERRRKRIWELRSEVPS